MFIVKINQIYLLMMKNKIIIAVVISLLIGFTACKENGFTVKGKFENNHYAYCVLDEVRPYEIAALDTILLINNGFSYFVNTIEKGFYRIRFDDTTFITFIAGDKDNISLTGDLLCIKNTQNIIGNEESKLFLEVNRKVHEMYLITDSLAKIFVAYKDTEAFDSIRTQLDSCYYHNFEYYKNYLRDFIIQHPNKLASISAFYQKIGYRNFFSDIEDKELLDKMIKELSIAYPSNQHVIALKERLEHD
jgi:hypothetical protein